MSDQSVNTEDNKDSINNTLVVSITLCIVCSVIVSTAAVVLQPAKRANQQLEIQRNVVQAGGLLREGATVAEAFSSVQTRIVDLSTGQFTDEINVETFDQFKSSRDPDLSRELSRQEDIATIKRLERFAKVYIVEEQEQIKKVILPVRGYGLWSTMFGYLALDGDANTVSGISFYEHGETPGLGGEIDNPRWKSQWPGKKIYTQDGDVAFNLVKVRAAQGSDQANYQVDSLSGATLTSRGVSNLVKFWLGDKGFEKFLTNLRNGDLNNG